MQTVKNHTHITCVILFAYDNVVYVPSRFMPRVVRKAWAGVWFCGGVFFLPAVGAKCHTGLLLWLCRHPMSTVWLAAAGVLSWGRDYFLVP